MVLLSKYRQVHGVQQATKRKGLLTRTVACDEVAATIDANLKSLCDMKRLFLSRGSTAVIKEATAATIASMRVKSLEFDMKKDPSTTDKRAITIAHTILHKPSKSFTSPYKLSGMPLCLIQNAMTYAKNREETTMRSMNHFVVLFIVYIYWMRQGRGITSTR